MLTSIWVLRTPNAGQNLLFQVFSIKKANERKLRQNLSLHPTQMLVEGYSSHVLKSYVVLSCAIVVIVCYLNTKKFGN